MYVRSLRRLPRPQGQEKCRTQDRAQSVPLHSVRKLQNVLGPSQLLHRRTSKSKKRFENVIICVVHDEEKREETSKAAKLQKYFIPVPLHHWPACRWVIAYRSGSHRGNCTWTRLDPLVWPTSVRRPVLNVSVLYSIQDHELGFQPEHWQTRSIRRTMNSVQTIPRFLLPRLSWTGPATASFPGRASFAPFQQQQQPASRSLHTSPRPHYPLARPRRDVSHQARNASLRRTFHASAPRQRDHHFDTLKFVQRLQEDGFTEDQSVAMMKVLNDVIEERSAPVRRYVLIQGCII